MADRPKPTAAGILLALSLFGGVGVGVALGEPTVGLLAGFALGVVLAIACLAASR